MYSLMFSELFKSDFDCWWVTLFLRASCEGQVAEIYSSVCLSTYLPTYLSVRLSVCLSVYLSIKRWSYDVFEIATLRYATQSRKI